MPASEAPDKMGSRTKSLIGLQEDIGVKRERMQVSVVMKFGGSSVANAERMREVAAIVCSFPDELPCVVLSAMGKVLLPLFISCFLRRSSCS